MTHLIDFKTISLFLDKPVDSDEVLNYMKKYNEKVGQLSESSFREYLEKGLELSEEQIIEKINFLKEENEEEFRNSPVWDDEFRIIFNNKIAELNKLIYDYYTKTLSDEQKIKVNEYLDEVEGKMKENYVEEKKIALEVIDSLLKEYHETGTIKSAEEVSKEDSDEITDEDLISMQEDLSSELNNLSQ